MISVDQSTPLWIASRIFLGERKADLLRLWKLSVKTYDVEDIHDLRVSSRRMRETLNLFSPCFPPKAVSSSSKAIRSLTQLLGAMRNTDVALQFFRAMGTTSSGHLPGTEMIVHQLEQERKRERGILEKELRGMSLSTVRSGLEYILLNPVIFCNSRIDPFMKIAEYGRNRIGERSDAIRELIEPSLLETNVTAQHRLRIAVKRLRYRYEILSPLCDQGEYERLHATAKLYQDLLGNIHDLDVFAQITTDRIPDQQHRLPLLEEIARKRHALFSEYAGLMEDDTLATLGDRMRRTL